MRRFGGAAPLIAAVTALMAQGGWAAAQPARPAPAPSAPASSAPASPSAEAPDRTSASFGDWVVRCEQRQGGGGRVCEMAETIADQRQQPVAVLALGRLAKDQPLRLVARIPVNVLVNAPMRLALEPAADSLSLPFRSCTPLGCFAEIELREEVLRKLRGRAADAAAKLEWKDAGGGEQSLPVSFRGFAAAQDALQREGG
ncbi:MAG TPA: invasion associated locus B family protein [Crenalkalicoccus sp.]|jgi:invasion protein IalB|nr:invasion associated locus B family protein [Crenalkalicoccus sp.]